MLLVRFVLVQSNGKMTVYFFIVPERTCKAGNPASNIFRTQCYLLPPSTNLCSRVNKQRKHLSFHYGQILGAQYEFNIKNINNKLLYITILKNYLFIFTVFYHDSINYYYFNLTFISSQPLCSTKLSQQYSFLTYKSSFNHSNAIYSKYIRHFYSILSMKTAVI